VLRTVTLIKLETYSSEEKKPFPVFKAVDLTQWICVYHKANYDAANNLLDTLQKCSKAYGINVAEPVWLELDSTKLKDWLEEVEGANPKKYQIVVFLLDRYLDNLYSGLKINSLSDVGYRSSVIKPESLSKNAMSVGSKFLLQVNYKLGGATYKVDFDSKVKVIFFNLSKITI
jgi:hypothetical protein